MIGHEFDLAVRNEGEGRVVLELRGDVNAAAATLLEAAHPLVDEPETRRLILDFEQVDYINSTGIALIVALLARARAADLSVVAYGLTDHYRQIFQITRLSDFMGIYPDRNSALRAAQA